MPKVVVAGATGGIGTYLVPFLLEKGCVVSNIVRNIEKSKNLFPKVERHIRWSDNGAINSILSDYDVIINLSGASIGTQRWTQSYKEEICKSRVETTRALVEKLNEFVTPKTYISVSAIGFYPNFGDKIIDEATEAGDSFLAKVCVRWEEEALKLWSIHRIVIGRLGVVLKPNDIVLRRMLMSYKFGFGVVIGTGNQWFSWIHIEDLLKAFWFAIENSNVQGVFNFTAPSPVRFSEMIQNVGKILKRPFILNVPEYLVKLIFGERTQMMLSSQRVIPKRLLELDFRFEFETIDKALRNLLN